MTRKHLLLASAILLVFGGGYLLFHRVSPQHQPHQAEKAEKVVGQAGYTVASLRKKYPHLQPGPQAWVEQQLKKPTRTWAEWIDTKVELHIHDFLYVRWNNGNPQPWFLEAYGTPEQLAAKVADSKKRFEKIAERHQERGVSVPPTAKSAPHFPQTQAELDNPHHLDIYEGPQDIEAIMTEFDHRYHRTFSGDRAEEIEAAYPKEAWIQAFLDKGGSFRDIYDYDKYMNSRGVLLMRSKDPSMWTSEIGGVRPAGTLEAYTDAFIEREIWIQETWKHALRENPDMTGIAIEGEHYLPMRKNLTYVRNDGNGGITSWGGMLSSEDHKNLLRGIEPEGMEVVYIDENYNVTSKPPPWDPNSPDANKSVENALRDQMSESFGDAAEAQPVEKSDAFVRPPSDAFATTDPDDAFARMAAAARESARMRDVARMEFERFQEEIRQIEKFQSMAADEMSREFALEFLSQYTPKSATDKRLQTALQTMFQRGFDDGLRSLRKDDPALAAELERYLAETRRPPQPQLRRLKTVPQKTVPPNPAETPPAADTD